MSAAAWRSEAVEKEAKQSVRCAEDENGAPGVATGCINTYVANARITAKLLHNVTRQDNLWGSLARENARGCAIRCS